MSGGTPHPDRLAALRQYIVAHDITGANRGQAITVNLTTAHSDWLRLAAHQTGPLGITQHQLVHGLIDWLAVPPTARMTARRHHHQRPLHLRPGRHLPVVQHPGQVSRCTNRAVRSLANAPPSR